MKILTLALFAILFASCTKESGHPTGNDLVKISSSMEDFDFNGNEAVLRLNDTAVGTGNARWTFSGSFTDSIKSDLDVMYYDLDAERNAIGDIEFICHLNPPTFAHNQYSGAGTWEIVQSNGTLHEKIKTGFGTLTYSQLLPIQEEDPIVRTIDLSGYGSR